MSVRELDNVAANDAGQLVTAWLYLRMTLSLSAIGISGLLAMLRRHRSAHLQTC